MRQTVFMIMMLLVPCLTITACDPSPMLYEQTMSLMDTRVTIQVYAQSQERAQTALHAAFSQMRQVEGIYSIYDEDSLLSELNEHKRLQEPPTEVVRVMRKAKYYGSITNGSFDVTVQPLLDLYSESFEEKHRPPTSEEINTTLSDIGYGRMSINSSSIRLEDGMKVTLGGIVKGYAIDRAHETLREHNITSALIDAGGDMRSIGTKPSGAAWRVAVRDPDGNQEALMDFPLTDRAVATSGNYERYYNENKSFHHLVDPRTGYSAEGVISATVLAPTATQADVLATASFVMGPEHGIALVERLDAVEALIVTSDRQLVYSSGFPR